MRIGILPATCKRGLHSLTETECSHAVHDAENLLRITCPACLAEPHPDLRLAVEDRAAGAGGGGAG